jgi:molybdate transport system substrate-binding protein
MRVTRRGRSPTVLPVALVSVLALVLGLGLVTPQSRAAEIQVLSGGAIAPPLEELAAQFGRISGHRVLFQSGTTPELIKAINTGSRFDLLVAPSDVLDDAGARARVVGPSRNVVRAGLGVAVRAGARRPDISTPDALRHALLSARSIATIPASATGARLQRIFERLGIADDMRSRIRVQATPEDIPRSLAAGQVDMAVFLTNVLTAPGVDIVGTFPAELQQDVVFTGAVARHAAQPEAARAFLRYLTSPAAGALFKARGLTAE